MHALDGQSEAVAPWFGGRGIDTVLCSPLRRAVQTAELLEPINDGPLISTDGLAQSPEPGFFDSLEGYSVACVGHEPWMGQALALLTTGARDGYWVRFKKGGVAWLRGQSHPGLMELRAFLPPRMMVKS